jgi:hypothetical protein
MSRLPRLALSALPALVSFAASPAPAMAFSSGQVVIAEQAVDPKSPTFEKDLHKAQKTSLKRDGGSWHMHAVAYLKKAAGAPEVNFVFYDVTTAGKREQVNAFPVGTQPTAKVLMTEMEVSTEQGFQPGHRYEVLVTRIVGGKEDVYARSTVELK